MATGKNSALVRRLPWVALLVVVAVAFAVGARGETSRSIDDQVFTIASTIRCPQCSGQSSATSDAPTAAAIRVDIKDRLGRGQSSDQIRDYYASRYGENILETPSRSGAASLVWILPVMVLVFAFAGLAWAFTRWRRDPDLVASDEDRELVAAARAAESDHGEGIGR